MAIQAAHQAKQALSKLKIVNTLIKVFRKDSPLFLYFAGLVENIVVYVCVAKERVQRT